MQVLQTAGVPPNSGRTILPTIGCTRNKRNALTKRVAAKNRATSGVSWERCVAIRYAEGEWPSIAAADALRTFRGDAARLYAGLSHRARRAPYRAPLSDNRSRPACSSRPRLGLPGF